MNNFKRTLFVLALLSGAAPLFAADPATFALTNGGGASVPPSGDLHIHHHTHGGEQSPPTWGQWGVSLAMNPKTWVVGGALGAVCWLGLKRRNRRLAREATEEFRTDTTTRLGNVEAAVAPNGEIRRGLAAVVAAVAEDGAMGRAIVANGEAVAANGVTLATHGGHIDSILADITSEEHGVRVLNARLTTLNAAVAQYDRKLTSIANGVAGLRDDLPGMLEAATEGLATADDVATRASAENLAALADRVGGVESHLVNIDTKLAAILTALERRQVAGGENLLFGDGKFAFGNFAGLGLGSSGRNFSFLTEGSTSGSGGNGDDASGAKKDG